MQITRQIKKRCAKAISCLQATADIPYKFNEAEYHTYYRPFETFVSEWLARADRVVLFCVGRGSYFFFSIESLVICVLPSAFLHLSESGTSSYTTAEACCSCLPEQQKNPRSYDYTLKKGRDIIPDDTCLVTRVAAQGWTYKIALCARAL